MFASIVISKVLVDVSAVGDINVIAPILVIELEFFTTAFVPIVTLLISDSDKYPCILIGFKSTTLNKTFPGRT